MQIHFGLDGFCPEWEAAVVCVGTFDGVHLGHREVISQAVALAAADETPAVILTFDRHPAAILAPRHQPPSLAPLEDNLAQFAGMGAALTVVLAFDERLSMTTAQEFLDEVLIARLRASRLVVGHDFAMGRGREGSGLWLAQRIATTIVPAMESKGQRISSSAIREAVSGGDMGAADRLLGRPFSVHGIVVQGAKLGRTLGYPTINLARSCNQVMPPNGIYGGYARTAKGHFAAAISIGVRPTVGEHNPRTIEAYLLDYPGESLYGTDVALDFRVRLRDEAKFENLEALMRQMEFDVKAVRDLK